MTDTFVPLVAAKSGPRESTFASLNLKPASLKSVSDAPTALSPSHQGESCGKPTITVTRTGEIVSGIRVQCGCGEVIELSCIY